MSDDLWPDNTVADPEPQAKGPSPADLRRTVDEAKAEAAAARRELALSKAGIDLDTPLGAFFAKSYDGESSAEAIKAEWAKLVPPVAPVAEDPAATPEELKMQAARRSLSGSGEAAPAVHEEDPYEAALKVYQKSTASGHTERNSQASYIAELFKAANAGDSRVDPRRNGP